MQVCVQPCWQALEAQAYLRKRARSLSRAQTRDHVYVVVRAEGEARAEQPRETGGEVHRLPPTRVLNLILRRLRDSRRLRQRQGSQSQGEASKEKKKGESGGVEVGKVGRRGERSKGREATTG
eukprot:756474-Hanusia_phi.AAC.2